MEKIGAVLVVGGGIAGIQASIDLADSGFKVFLVDSSTSIGGVMAQLDKTFPTNDCSMCILAPKLIEAGRHQNIQLITNTEVESVDGDLGHFKVNLLKKSRFIDEDKCTGCGICARECIMEAIDVFNEGLSTNSAVSVKYPQAVPLIYSIDQEKCLGCGICSGVCKAHAIEYSQEDKEFELEVGAIILAIGFDEFDPSIYKSYGYGKYQNVITSIEFERILSASGPYSGMVIRPFDGEIPEKIAFLQCVGSRDPAHGKEYCSSVCCMYTCKEAVIAKEHQHQVNPTIFSMDIRAYGKDFDKYIERAKEEYGIRYIRRRIATIEEDPDTKNLILTYEGENGEIIEEVFQLVVLSVGLNPTKSAKQLAEKLNVELDEYGFCKKQSFNPVETSRPGVYVCGVFSSPKDIPESVMEASAAAGQVQQLLAPVRGELVTAKEYPEEIDVYGQPPRIGVFICHCGINIGGVVDVPAVVEYAKKLPNVILADRNLYTCSADTQTKIKDMVEEHKLNRVIVASCTPRTHEPLFQETCREAGLNPYLFEMANIRDQCSWVHMNEPEMATEKAKDLVRMAVAKASIIEPLQKISLNVIKKALVIGGGIAGMAAALGFAKQGFGTYLIEKSKQLGGFAKNIHLTLENNKVQKFLQGLIAEVENEKNIETYLDSSIEAINGYVGNFSTMINQNSNNEKKELEHGVIIVATGAQEYEPKEYFYGEDPRVITQSELEKRLFSNKNIGDHKKIVMIQCVGSRNEEHPYCSRVCCSEAIKNALRIKEQNSDGEIFILYRDVRTYGLKEKYYRFSREKGISFIRFDEKEPPIVNKENGSLKITLSNSDTEKISINADLLVLSAGIVAPSSNAELAPLLKVPLNEDGFFLEAHMKLRPVDFATEGIFLCGLAHAPKSISESIAQANAAVSRACTILSKDYIEAEGVISSVDPEICIGCGSCVEVCPYNAISLVTSTQLLEEFTVEVRKSEINPALCKGCGKCVPRCPVRAITQKHFTNEQITLMEDVLLS
ncbi:MAG: CoB--CoM heterodisulfide reductase iron-sulfur subunit A family protein [Candidatus Helarchaeota archaeon]|nr:CoB--CoM heterodisulfide reductase iron-sulfur subunit A family protein [Candidatus Helarchaeota archaeon]